MYPVQQAIVAVQQISIPLTGISVAVDPEIFQDEMASLLKVTSEFADAELAAASIDPRTLRMMELGARPDPSGLATRAGKLRNQYYDLLHQLENHLGRRFLPNVSLAIRQHFNDALGSWRSAVPAASVLDFVERYRAMASLLQHPVDVINNVAMRDWRVLNKSAQIRMATGELNSTPDALRQSHSAS